MTKPIKKMIVPLILLITIISTLIFGYLKYWQEPKAIYLKTNNPKLENVRKNLTALKDELRKKGLYSCCIRNDCNWCALQMGHCPCASLVMEKGEEKSCPECAAAWNRKLGKIPGIDPKTIKVTTFGIYCFEKSGHHHEIH